MSITPLVSVIVPTYNYGRFITQTFESLQRQTHTRWECIVVDDGSTDDTRDVVTRFVGDDARFRYVHQNNQGLAAARNTGIENSGGDYVQFLDADDLIEAEKLELQLRSFERNPEADIVYGSVRYFRTEAPHERLYCVWGEDKPWMPGASGRGKTVLTELVRRNIMAVNAPLLRRKVIDDVGRFDGTVKGVEDWDYWIRCAMCGKHLHHDPAEGTLALVRFHPTSMSRDTRAMLRSMLLVREKVNVAVTDADIANINREISVNELVQLASEEIAHGRTSEGIRRLLKAVTSTRRLRWKLKLTACAVAAPLTPKNYFPVLVTSSFTHAMFGYLKSSLSSRRARRDRHNTRGY